MLYGAKPVVTVGASLVGDCPDRTVVADGSRGAPLHHVYERRMRFLPHNVGVAVEAAGGRTGSGRHRCTAQCLESNAIASLLHLPSLACP